MALLVGDNGKVFSGNTEVADITSWTFETSVGGFSFSTSHTKGYTRRILGNKSGRGKFTFRVDTNEPPWEVLYEGCQTTLKLKLDSTRYYSVPAVIETLKFEVDTSGGKPIVGEATFVTDRAWTEPS
jgi:hypothetical protein